MIAVLPAYLHTGTCWSMYTFIRKFSNILGIGLCIRYQITCMHPYNHPPIHTKHILILHVHAYTYLRANIHQWSSDGRCSWPACDSDVIWMWGRVGEDTEMWPLQVTGFALVQSPCNCTLVVFTARAAAKMLRHTFVWGRVTAVIFFSLWLELQKREREGGCNTSLADVKASRPRRFLLRYHW